LSFKAVTDNPNNRCYYCKQQIFGQIITKAKEDGYRIILDGTNASDDADDRPGMKALKELNVLSPLRMCGLTKAEIREKSKEAGLFTWDKPAYACLATRIPTGEEITKEKLEKIEQAEDFLLKEGFTDFRVRTVEGHARIEVPDAQWMKLAECRDKIYEGLRGLFKTVSINLKGR
ncbi:MAG: ATP-dependent sacrificial sulfur transferase LarE, partial [Lachnospiraceae bacterium]|nr:ATP-dependent sacrificial sulfur transferase LarE [Lachnospiraceae bacterium]